MNTVDTSGSRRDIQTSRVGSDVAVRVVVLVGFMGAGKTTVGRALGQRLGWSFEDLDDRIQTRENRTIANIFREGGEVGFRAAEKSALREALAEARSGSRRVLAVGGGAFVQAENASLLDNADTPTIFLDAPAQELWKRCGTDPIERPLRRQEAEFHELYEARRPHYLRAMLRVETGGRNIEHIVDEIVGSLRLEVQHRDGEK